MIKKVLICDDSPIARIMLKNCIPKDKGYEIHEATNGQEGLEKYIEVRSDVTFMDLTMPIMGGIESLKKIIEVDRNAKVVVVTSDIQVKSIKKVMTSGAFIMIKKPFTKGIILKVLSQVEVALEKPVEKKVEKKIT